MKSVSFHVFRVNCELRVVVLRFESLQYDMREISKKKTDYLRQSSIGNCR